MPSIKTEITAEVDVDFEVYCSCGYGMCGNTDTRESRNRRYPQVVVGPCPKCLEAARDESADKMAEEMQRKIDDLESLLDAANAELNAMRGGGGLNMTYEDRYAACVQGLKDQLRDLQLQYEQAAAPLIRRLRKLEGRSPPTFTLTQEHAEVLPDVSARPEDAPE